MTQTWLPLRAIRARPLAIGLLLTSAWVLPGAAQDSAPVSETPQSQAPQNQITPGDTAEVNGAPPSTASTEATAEVTEAATGTMEPAAAPVETSDTAAPSEPPGSGTSASVPDEMAAEAPVDTAPIPETVTKTASDSAPETPVAETPVSETPAPETATAGPAVPESVATEEAVATETAAPNTDAPETATADQAPEEPQIAAEPAAAEDPAPTEEPAVAETAPAGPDPAAVAAAIEAALDAPDTTGAADHKAVATFYAEREFAPLWIDAGKLDGAARAVAHRIDRAHVYGLDAARYDLPPLDVGLDGTASADDLAAADLRLTVAALKFAGDAQAGTFDPSVLGELMTAKPVRPAHKSVLDGLAAANDKVAYLEGFNPPHPRFAALKNLLTELRSRSEEDTPPLIGEGPTLKPGMADARIPMLRGRLGLPEIAGEGALVYDDATVEAVKAFQDAASLDVDGVIGPQTRLALNGGTQISTADVLVNMERWRWVPRDMGSHHVWVNIPEYQLRVVTNGASEFETRVIVGTSQNQTPIFSDEIEYVDVNPYWNVPRSIAVKEMMPEVRRDPDFFARRGLEVIYTGGGSDMVIDPRSVDWNLWDGETMPFRFRQPPGGANALGRVKFMFPNKHAVYLHDTPTRNLFSRSVRSFSHGCVRVDKAWQFRICRV